MNAGYQYLPIGILALLIAFLTVLPIGYVSNTSPVITTIQQPENDLGRVCRETVNGWEALLPGDIPQHLMSEDAERSPSDFDVNRAFDVFDRLSLPEGMVLDYVYYYDGMGGFPVLYTRPADQDPYLTAADLPNTNGEWPNFSQDIIIEETPTGYLQFALFEMLVPQFYIFWHAGYGMRDIICDNAALDEMIEQVRSGDFGMPLEDEATASARKLDVTPVVTINDESATVEIVYFSYWGGFIRQKISIQRSAPRPPVEESRDVLVPYESGIMF